METLTNDKEQKIALELELIVDSIGLKRTVILLSKICSEKADHIAENFQDKPLAVVWDIKAMNLLKMANKLEIKGE